MLRLFRHDYELFTWNYNLELLSVWTLSYKFLKQFQLLFSFIPAICLFNGLIDRLNLIDAQNRSLGLLYHFGCVKLKRIAKILFFLLGYLDFV